MRRAGAMALALALAAVAVASPAAAHTGHGTAFALADGLLHPLLGLDHLLAMLAVGFWAAQLGGRALVALPVAFPLVMSLGALAALSGVHASATELAILASLVALGAAIAWQLRPPLAMALAVCSLFALAHGLAHGHEAPAEAAKTSYVAGLAATTALLHAVGAAIGYSAARSVLAGRAFGIAVAAAGVALALQ